MSRFFSWFYSAWVRFRQGVLWQYLIRKVVAGFYSLRNALGYNGCTEEEGGSGGPRALPEAVVGKRALGSEEDGGSGEPGGLREAPAGKRAEESEEDEEEDEEYGVDPTDELYCEYDSTWDPEDQQDPPDWTTSRFRSRSRSRSRSYKFRRFEDAARDMQNYRHDYPSKRYHWRHEAPNGKPNLEFYLGQSPSSPDGLYIYNFHDWHGKYERLEHVHTYIQWLFPLQEPGVNHQASVLTTAEIQEFHQNAIARENLLKSYKLMLDFYGIELCDEETGQVQRSSNWSARFDNLNNHTHNNLRITRILKCLATLGYAHYQEPLVRFYLEETLVHGELANVKDSALNYFIFAVRDKKQRRKLLKFAYLNYNQRDEFVWCPKKVQMKWSGVSTSKQDTCRVSPHPSGPWRTQSRGVQAEDEPSPSVVDV